MTFNGSEWWPVDHVPMPHHHATRLELTNVMAFPALASHQGKRLRFTVELSSRDIHQVPGRREWRVTCFARIVSVCVPDLG
jgi:hypothetical protein